MVKIKGGTINAIERKIFNYISSPKFTQKEYGGYMDFNTNKKLERFRTNIGGYNYVDVDTDYEVIYHTHPTRKGQLSPPSPDDILVIISSPKQQAHIIFNNVITYIVVVTPKARGIYSHTGDYKYEQTLNNIWNYLYKKHRTNNVNKKFEQEWIKILQSQFGFKVIRERTTNKSLNVPIKIVEPKTTKRTPMFSTKKTITRRKKRK